MKNFFTKKIFSLFFAVIFIAFGVFGTLIVGHYTIYQADTSLEYLYSQAVKDSMTIEPNEILPVVEITTGSDMATLNDENEVLLITWHKYPDSYPEGQQITLSYGEVWTFTDKEIAAWYDNNSSGVKDWELRFEQLLGLPYYKEYTYFTAIWVPVDSIKRPAYSYDIKTDIDTTIFTESDDESYIEWFNSNIIYSYFESSYPWTRLGYTYDWADNGTEYGLSEFIVEKDTVATVEFTYTTDEFLEWLDKQ
ncbi:MAG: hypothetical protein A2Y17_02625 [Clostridiales bacterium GWF2_38_85]|nr:MAG: hypothetical protein A2Y17_02625 [Clostridiales bacterium GWF2_38_85]